MGTKPIGMRAYGSIPHLPGSRRGPGDHGVNEGMERICTTAAERDRKIIVQEKLDGSCVAVARIGDEIVALGRAGWLASSSPYVQHHYFAEWVEKKSERFHTVLCDGERIVGEWLAQAHGTRYDLKHEPFVAFDIMRGPERMTFLDFLDRLNFAAEYGEPFVIPRLISCGAPMGIETALECLDAMNPHGALDEIEGAVWRVERGNEVEFLAKYVRPGKADGRFLPEISGGEPVWNWKPVEEATSA